MKREKHTGKYETYTLLSALSLQFRNSKRGIGGHSYACTYALVVVVNQSINHRFNTLTLATPGAEL